MVLWRHQDSVTEPQSAQFRLLGREPLTVLCELLSNMHQLMEEVMQSHAPFWTLTLEEHKTLPEPIAHLTVRVRMYKQGSGRESKLGAPRYADALESFNH